MSKRIELPGDAGQFIEVKDLADLTAGDRRKAKAAVEMRIDPKTGESILSADFNERMKNALAASIITSWNLQWPVPKGNPAVLDKLTMDQIDALYEGIKEHIDACSDQPDPMAEGTVPTDSSAI